MFATTHRSTKFHAAGVTDRTHMTDLKSSSAIRADREMRHDRWIAGGVLLLFGVLLAALMYVAIMFGNPSSMDSSIYDYWMMP